MQQKPPTDSQRVKKSFVLVRFALRAFPQQLTLPSEILTLSLSLFHAQDAWHWYISLILNTKQNVQLSLLHLETFTPTCFFHAPHFLFTVSYSFHG